jgi:hypothetical protein
MGNGNDPYSNFIGNVLDAWSQFERELIGERTRAALAVLRAQKRRSGTIPWGFRLASDGVHLEPDAYEQDVFDFIHSLRNRGARTHEIWCVLQGNRLLSRTGAAIGKKQIRTLLARVRPPDAPEIREPPRAKRTPKRRQGDPVRLSWAVDEFRE